MIVNDWQCPTCGKGGIVTSDKIPYLSHVASPAEFDEAVGKLANRKHAEASPGCAGVLWYMEIEFSPVDESETK